MKKKGIILSLMLSFVGVVLWSPVLAACPSGTAPISTGSSICVPTKAATGLSDTSIGDILSVILNWLLYLLAGFAVLIFIIAGYMYLTSAGDEKRVESAKNTVKWAIIGLAVALSGLVIIRMVDGILQGDATKL